MKHSRLGLILVSVAIMAAGSLTLVRLSASQALGRPGVRGGAEDPETGRLELSLPARILDYTSTNVPPTQAEQDTLPKDTSFAKRHYRAPDGFQIALTVVLMGTDRTSIHKPEYCLTSQGWQITGRETVSVKIGAPHPYALPARLFTTERLLELQGGQARRDGGVYLFWFVADGRVAAGHFERLAKMTWDLLCTGNLPRWAYISCFAPCAPGSEAETAERVERFVAAAVPEFQVVTLPETGPQER
ncbi:MAG: exosortase-associated EpsI family protein [Verrucomicrobiae bacterium]|nr:exosortase-associated EpsI family protein [Verrucomicrobiae bacterium]